jgi:hypothetical protein
MLKNGDLHHMGSGPSEGHPCFSSAPRLVRASAYSSALARYYFVLTIDRLSPRKERDLSAAAPAEFASISGLGSSMRTRLAGGG